MNHNMMLNRQSYLDYTSYSNPGKQELRNTQPPKEVILFYKYRRKTLILSDLFKIQVLLKILM